ncbi:hypothetical protein Tco_0826392, partial [Tanacetum coccineum]
PVQDDAHGVVLGLYLATRKHLKSELVGYHAVYDDVLELWMLLMEEDLKHGLENAVSSSSRANPRDHTNEGGRKRIAEEPSGKDRFAKDSQLLRCDEDNYHCKTPVLPIQEPDNSLSMGDEGTSLTIIRRKPKYRNRINKASVERPCPNSQVRPEDCNVNLTMIILSSDELYYGEDYRVFDASPPEVEIVSLEVIHFYKKKSSGKFKFTIYSVGSFSHMIRSILTLLNDQDFPDGEDSRACNIPQEFHILSFILGIQYPNLID